MHGRFLAMALLLLALLLAGCSGSGGDEDSDDSDGDGGDGGDLTVGDGTTTPASTPATSAAGTTAPADYGVELYDNRYDPTTLAVPNFQKVVFTNKGTLSHTVTIVKQGDPPGTYLRDQPIQPNATTDFNFPSDGTYTIYCRYHGTESGTGMAMTVTV